MKHALLARLLQALPITHHHPDIDHFYNLMRDYPTRGGKMLRGQLVLLSSAAHGQPWHHDDAAGPDVLGVGAGLELFQNWVLVHDDIEDASDERRGKPALHHLAGVPLALNVGDAMHVYMWQLLHHLRGFSPKQHLLILGEFEQMIHRTAEGQHLDLAWVEQGRFDISEADYMQMVTLKTAHYTVVSPLRLGALCANLTPHALFLQAGTALGCAFQIRDDVLNLMPEVSYGKEFAGDLYEAKRTLILAHTFAHANSDETARLIETLAKAREHKTEEDITWVLRTITCYKSLDYAQTIAETHAQKGLTLLTEALAPLAHQDAVQELMKVLNSLVVRRT